MIEEQLIVKYKCLKSIPKYDFFKGGIYTALSESPLELVSSCNDEHTISKKYISNFEKVSEEEMIELAYGIVESIATSILSDREEAEYFKYIIIDRNKRKNTK